MRLQATRRRLASHLLALASVKTFLPPRAGNAARGAAELDAEFYLRGLLGQPTAPPVKAVPLPTPRRLSGPVVCPLVSALVGAVGEALGVSADEVRSRAAKRAPALAIEYERAWVSGAFGQYDTSQRGLQLNAGGVCETAGADEGGGLGQFDFELSVYCYFTLLGEARLPPAKLAAWYTLLGDRLLAAARAQPLSPPLPATPPDMGAPPPTLRQLEAGLRSLLELLKRAGYLQGFTLDGTDADETLWAKANDLSLTRYALTLSDPATLHAALQLNAATGGRVAPGLAVPLLLAYLRAAGVSLVQTPIQYFIDDEYKPNPLEYRPSSLVVEFELSPVALKS
tara:strand:- start:92 stop:1111 length:1020 start_codon:yes stop_codon:yes gene_type:complete